MVRAHDTSTVIASYTGSAWRAVGVALLLGVCLALAPAPRAQSEVDSMPPGGKALLLRVLGTPTDIAELERIAAGTHSDAEWAELLAPRTDDLNKRKRKTLAAYLAAIMPLKAGALEQARAAGDVTKALPPDGRDVAASKCQTSCHSLITVKVGYRDFEGWKAMFTSKRHEAGLVGITDAQIEAFARYAAINLPAY